MTGGRRGARLPRGASGLSDPLAREFARTFTVDVVEFGPGLLNGALGQALCWRERGSRLGITAACRTGLSDDEQRAFEQWARQRAYLLALTADPGFDGWHRTGRRRWELTFCPDAGPADPFPVERLGWL